MPMSASARRLVWCCVAALTVLVAACGDDTPEPGRDADVDGEAGVDADADDDDGDADADADEEEAEADAEGGPCGGSACAGALFCDGGERALVLVDRRLYAEIFEDLHAYLQAACGRRGFAIRLTGVEGLDDLSPQGVRDLLIAARAENAALEGVLFVGAVAVPTFFMSRIDTPQTLYWPRYYEDLDMIPSKTIPDGTQLEACQEPTDAEGYPSNWPCLAPGIWSVPFTVPTHDFDDFEQGPHAGLELWAAFLPVGFSGTTRNNYARWGEQLRGFLRKTLAFYADPSAFARDLYHVGNDLNLIAQVGTVWDEVGPEHIDYYAINTLGEGACIDNPACYVRAPLEDFDSLEAFVAYARTLPWMDEGWQDPEVFLSHMNGGDRFPRRVVWWNVHSTGGESLITAAQARDGIEPGQGGVIGLLSGCMVGAFQRPGDALPPDLWEIPSVHGNVMVSLIYGQSAFQAAIGSVPLRVSDALYGTLLDAVYVDTYLGLANRGRSDACDQADDRPFGWRNHQDILLGDPFVDVFAP
jgi:hypothetical protein